MFEYSPMVASCAFRLEVFFQRLGAVDLFSRGEGDGSRNAQINPDRGLAFAPGFGTVDVNRNGNEPAVGFPAQGRRQRLAVKAQGLTHPDPSDFGPSNPRSFAVKRLRPVIQPGRIVDAVFFEARKEQSNQGSHEVFQTSHCLRASGVCLPSEPQ